MHTPIIIHKHKKCLQFPWHPSVIYTEKGWSGHCWWMALTPYPPYEITPYRDRYELPCIYYSDNGIEWWPIPNNPIQDLSEIDIQSHNYYSDPHLVLHNGKLECYYRFSILKDRQIIGNKTLFLKKESRNGRDWSEAFVIADLRSKNDSAIWGEQIISPSVCWDGTQYLCWYVDRSSYLPNRKIRRTVSKDALNWMSSVECQLPKMERDPWHIDVQFYNNLYQLIIYDLWGLKWYESKDGLQFSFVSDILQPSWKPNDFFKESLYRACSVQAKENIYVYFSAHNGKKTNIGIMQTQNRDNFTLINGQKSFPYYISFLLPLQIGYYTYKVRKKIHSFISEQIFKKMRINL